VNHDDSYPIISTPSHYISLLKIHSNTNSDKDYGYQKSSVKQGDVNPVWNEDFQFNIPTLDNMVLTLQVFDSDIGSRDDNCGRCKIKLEKEGITSSPKRFEKTIDRNLIRANGTLTVDISYHS